jgi:hypothetical protein
MEKLDKCTQLWQNLMTPTKEISNSIELLPSMEMLALGMLPDLKSNLQRFVRFSASNRTLNRTPGESYLPNINDVIQAVTKGNEASKLRVRLRKRGGAHRCGQNGRWERRSVGKGGAQKRGGVRRNIHINKNLEAEGGGITGMAVKRYGGGGGNKIATQVGGAGTVKIMLDNSDSFFGSNIYGTLIASAICVEWLCSPMPDDIVYYKKNDALPGDIPTKWTCETWSNNSIKKPKPWKIKIPWFSGGTKEIDAGWWQDFLTLSSDGQAGTQSHISNIVWSGLLENTVDPRETINKLYPSSLFVGRGLIQSIERWVDLSGNTQKEKIKNRIGEMVRSFKVFVEKILDGDEGKKRMQQWQNRYSLDYRFENKKDAASALMNLLTNEEDGIAKKLVTVWYNETKFTFADTSNNNVGAGSVVENPPDPRKNLESSEEIDKLYGDFSYAGLVYKLLYLIQANKGVKMLGVFSIFNEGASVGGNRDLNKIRQELTIVNHTPQGVSDDKLVEYLKYLIGPRDAAGDAAGDAATVLGAIYNTGIYMIVNLPSHGHTVLVLLKNNQIYTAGAGLWGGGRKELLCFSPDDTMFVDTSGGLASTRFQEGNKKLHELNIITKVGFINEKLLENLTTFAKLSDFVDKFTLQSKTYHYNRTNLYTDNPPTLSCSSWVWLMVEGNVNSGIRKLVSLNNPYSRRGPFYGISTNQLNPEAVSITSIPPDEEISFISQFLDRIGGGGKKNTRIRRRRKRNRTKRSKPNKKKRTKKHRKKRKYTKYRR